MLEFGISPVACRTAVVPACDAELPYDAPADALATFRMSKRDQLDFTVDYRAWMQANGAPKMTSALFATNADSPKTPTIVSQDSSTSGLASITIAVPVGGVVGDAYKIDVTANFPAKTATGDDDIDIGARRLVRRIDIVVVPG